MCRLILFFGLWLLISISWGQSFTIYNISIPEGLPSSEVYEVFQDSQGFLWFATDNGVVKFDGKDFETFHAKEGLSDPVVFGFCEDKKGRIWFRTFSGKIFYYTKGKIRPYKNNAQLSRFINKSYIYHFYVDNDDALWFSTKAILGKIDSLGIYSGESLPKSGFLYKNAGNVGLMGMAGPFPITYGIINDQKFSIKQIESKDPGGHCCSIIWRNKVYLSIKTHIYEYDGKSIREVFLANAPIISLSKDAEDNLWVGYQGKGAVRFSMENFQDPWSPSFLKNRSVSRVFQDDEGGLWISTLEKGVYYLPNLKIEEISLPSETKIMSVVATPDYVAIGNNLGGLSAYDVSNKKRLWNRSFDSPIYSLFYLNKNLWVSSLEETFLLNNNFNKQLIHYEYGRCFAKGSGETVWAIAPSKISKYDKNGKSIYYQNSSELYRKIFVEDSLLYLTPRTGLHLFNVNTNKLTPIERFEDFKISQTTSLNDTTLLLATIGGGFLLVDKRDWKYTQFDSRNNFIANNIYAVEKNDSMLWLGTEKGVISIYIDSLTRGHFSFNYITQKSGLKSDKINHLASTNKDLWVFFDEGISIIPYNISQFSNKTPQLYIKKLTINNQPFEFKDRIKLKYNQNNIQITFGYISFNNQNILTRFRLSPKDPWIQSNDRSIQLASLSPGEYALELEYSVDNINWICSDYPLFIIISPPWWERWYVQLGAFIILLSLIYIYYKNQLLIYKQRDQYHKVVNEYQQKLIYSEIETLERERSRISKDLHDGVSTNLTAIKLSVSRLLGTYNKPAAIEVEDQLQGTIREIKDIIYALTPPGLERYGLVTGISNFIEKLNETIPVKIELNSYGEKNIDGALSILIFRVVQELISNSLKHAHAKNIIVHINTFDDLLNIVYEDDGIGFSSQSIKKGLGLDNVESRIQSVNGNIKFESGKFGVSYSIDIPFDSKRNYFDYPD